MGRGKLYRGEGRTFCDARTGVEVRQVTDFPCVHHHPFYYIPAYDDRMHHLVFVSHRTGRPEIFLELRGEGALLQLTDHPGLAEWSVAPAHDGRYVYFTDGGGAWRVETETGREQCLVDFGQAELRERGVVGAAMGTTALSYDDAWWAVPIRVGEVARLVVVDTESGRGSVVLERDSIGHPEFHPDDAAQLRYAGSYRSRIWVVRRDGSDHRLVYERDAGKKEWIVHETWRPGGREILTTQWPHGVLGIHVDTGAVRRVTAFPAWHPAVDRRGERMVADTTFPDRGLFLFSVEGEDEAQLLCLSESSNEGAHWNTDHCPYDDGPVQVYAPQHTHPHPSFSPDGRFAVFTSDRTGRAQVYEVRLR